MGRKPQTWRRYSHVLSKGLISRICKEFLLTEKKKTYLFLNGQRHDGTFTEKESQTGYNMNRYSASLVVQEMQAKTTVRYYFISARLGKNNLVTGCVDKGTEQEFLSRVGGSID